jgi:AraC-like DNA-binding protein
MTVDAETQVRLADIRMDGVTFGVWRGEGEFAVSGRTGAVSLCYLVRRGSVWLEVQSAGGAPVFLSAGSVVGLSGLVPHWLKSDGDVGLKAAAPLVPLPLATPHRTPAEVEILVGEAPVESLAAITLVAGISILTPEDQPYNGRVWRAMDLAEAELLDAPRLPGSEAVLRRCAELMLLNIARWTVERGPAGAVGRMGALADPRILRALAAAAREPVGDWTLSSMARAAGMSRTVFAQRFHQLVGATPLRSVIQMRLRLAAVELANSARGVEDIALGAGYGSAAAFIRAFQRLYHMPPARWRAERRRAESPPERESPDDRSILSDG